MAWLGEFPASGEVPCPVFANPTRREWQEVCAEADPVEGVRAFLVGERLIVWGALPLHRQALAHLETMVDPAEAQASTWIPLNILPNPATALVTSGAPKRGRAVPLGRYLADVMAARGLRRLLGDSLRITASPALFADARESARLQALAAA